MAQIEKQEGWEELSQEEQNKVDGGDWRETVNGLIDKANDWLDDRHIPLHISHI